MPRTPLNSPAVIGRGIAPPEGSRGDSLLPHPVGGTEAVPDPGSGADRSIGWIVGIVGLALSYATLRYNVVKGVAWADWPSYTLNKALGFSALILMVLSVARLGRADGPSPARLMLGAGLLAYGHVLLSITLLGDVYYPKFFADGRLTAVAGLSIFLGALSAVLLELGARRSKTWGHDRRLTFLSFLALAIGGHAALPGISGWFTPSTWPGWLPPITLLSFLFALAAPLIWLRHRVKRNIAQ